MAADQSKDSSPDSLMGHHLPSPKRTANFYLGLALYIGVPIFAALFLLDLVFYYFFTEALDGCYGILCLFD